MKTQCPTCSANAETGIPVMGEATHCHKCGWIKIESVRLKYMNVWRDPDDPEIKTIVEKNAVIECCLCGMPRTENRKIIRGTHGGVCVECVELVMEILQQEAAKKAAAEK